MEEINQNQLNGNQNYENGDIDMEAGFEGMSKLSVYWVKNIYFVTLLQSWHFSMKYQYPSHSRFLVLAPKSAPPEFLGWLFKFLLKLCLNP